MVKNEVQYIHMLNMCVEYVWIEAHKNNPERCGGFQVLLRKFESQHHVGQ